MAQILSNGLVQFSDGRILYSDTPLTGQDFMELQELLPKINPVIGRSAMVGFPFVSGGGGGAGTPGAPGAAGPQGVTGVAGGGTGPQGVTGLQGVTGPSGGPVGATGVQGTTGSQGVTGVQGQTGIQGSTGAGVPGATGTQGPQGQTGIQGPAGGAGVQGVTGTQGIQGVTGSGAQGATGPAQTQVLLPFWYGDGSTGNLTLVADTVLPQGGGGQAFGTFPANYPSYGTLDLSGFGLFSNINDMAMFVRAKTGIVGPGFIICKDQLGGAQNTANPNDHGGNGGQGGYGQGLCAVFAKQITGAVHIGALNQTGPYGNAGSDGEAGIVSPSNGQGNPGLNPGAIGGFWMGRNSTAQTIGNAGNGATGPALPGPGGNGGARAISSNVFQMFALLPQMWFTVGLVNPNSVIENFLASIGMSAGSGGNGEFTNAGPNTFSGGGGAGGGGGLGGGGHGGSGTTSVGTANAGSGGGGGGGGGAGGGTVVGSENASSTTTVRATGGNGGNGGANFVDGFGGVGAGGGGGAAIGTSQTGSGWTVTAAAGANGATGGTGGATPAEAGIAYNVS